MASNANVDIDSLQYLLGLLSVDLVDALAKKSGPVADAAKKVIGSEMVVKKEGRLGTGALRMSPRMEAQVPDYVDWSEEEEVVLVEEVVESTSVGPSEVSSVGGVAVASAKKDSEVLKKVEQETGLVQGIPSYDATGGHYAPGDEGSFFRVYVKTAENRAFAELLAARLGTKVPRKAAEDLALVRYSAATVPTAFVDGRKRLRQLACQGDAALSYALVCGVIREGGDVASVQAVKSTYLSNAVMARNFTASRLSERVVYASGVDASTSKAGADALEALAGVIVKHMGMDALEKYACWMQLMHMRK